MNIRHSVEKLFIKASRNRFVDKRTLTKSYVSLFVAVTVLFTATYGWFTARDSASLDTSAIEMTASSGLRVNNGEDLSGIVKLSTEVTLAEASSVDGRNMYFPTTGTFSSSTSSMTFRDANAGDKNKKFFYNDFSLTSDSGDTDVYVKSYLIKVDDQTFDGSSDKHEECPLRIAFMQDSSQTPILIDPTALLGSYVKNYNAVSTVDPNGTATTQLTNAHALSEYYFATDNPIFTIPSNEKLNLSMAIWLEGTGENCDKYAGKNVSVEIQFESNWDYMDTVKFIDDTVGDKDTSVKHWVNSDGCLVTMSYLDTKTNETKVINMTKSANYSSDYTWKAALPKGIVTNITFNRYNPKSEVVWNAWYTYKGVNNGPSDQAKFNPPLQESRLYTSNGKTMRSVTYVAKGGNGHETSEYYRPYPCRGYWQEISGDEEVTTSPTQATEATEATTKATEATVVTEPVETTIPDTIRINIALNDESSSRWLYSNCYNNGCKLYAVFDDGSKVELPITADNRFNKEGFSVKYGVSLVSFEEWNSYQRIHLFDITDVKVESGYYYNYRLDSTDTVVKQ